jgi:hypothetical protein
MDQPRYDEGQWPIVLVTMPDAELKEPDLLRHIDRMSSFSKRGVAFVQVIDVRTAGSLSAHSRRLVAERMDQDEDAYPGVLLGVAIVLATPLHRGIFKAISWLSRKPRPFEAFTGVDEAMLWARRLVAVPARSMTMPVATDVSKRVG